MTTTPQAMARLLERHGPLWVVGDDAIAGNRLVHAVIVTGMSGDGTPQGTTVAFVDPSPAASGTPETFAEFARRLDATDVVSLGLGLMHF